MPRAVDAATADDGRVRAQQFMSSAAPALVNGVSVAATLGMVKSHASR